MTRIFTMISVSTLITLLGVSAWAGTYANVNKSGVLLDGYDVVSYFNSDQPQMGDAKLQVQLDGVTYWFANEANRSAFQKEPLKYIPQYGAWCAYAVADSKSKVEVDPKSFLIQDGKLFVFYKGLWGDTRDKWLHTKGKDAQAYQKEADANWPTVKPKDP